jgi:type II secretory pathway component PulM
MHDILIGGIALVAGGAIVWLFHAPILARLTAIEAKLTALEAAAKAKVEKAL